DDPGQEPQAPASEGLPVRGGRAAVGRGVGAARHRTDRPAVRLLAGLAGVRPVGGVALLAVAGLLPVPRLLAVAGLLPVPRLLAVAGLLALVPPALLRGLTPPGLLTLALTGRGLPRRGTRALACLLQPRLHPRAGAAGPLDAAPGPPPAPVPPGG